MLRTSESLSEVPRRCGLCSSAEHTSPDCPHASEQEKTEVNDLDARQLAILENGRNVYVRCASCGCPTRERASAFYTSDTNDTLCNDCGRTLVEQEPHDPREAD